MYTCTCTGVGVLILFTTQHIIYNPCLSCIRHHIYHTHVPYIRTGVVVFLSFVLHSTSYTPHICHLQTPYITQTFRIHTNTGGVPILYRKLRRVRIKERIYGSSFFFPCLFFLFYSLLQSFLFFLFFLF